MFPVEQPGLSSKQPPKSDSSELGSRKVLSDYALNLNILELRELYKQPFAVHHDALISAEL